MKIPVSPLAAALVFVAPIGELLSQAPPPGRGRGFGPPAGRGPEGGRRGGGPRPEELGEAALDLGEPGIAWYPRLEDGLEEAARSNRPILFMAVASQCGGVPGVF